MANFPALRSGVVGMHPSTHRVSIPTEIVVFANGAEQRWMSASRLDHWGLLFTDVGLEDLNTLRAFYDSVKGSFDNTFTLPIGGVSYTYCGLETDEFRAVENRTGRYTLEMPVHQQIPQQKGLGGGSTTFPLLSTGAVTQLPYGTRGLFFTARNELECGKVHSYYFRASALWAWEISYEDITDAELAAVVLHFHTCGGATKTFSFTDPNGAGVFANCRYGTDALVIRHLGPDQNAVSFLIEEHG